MQMHGEVEENDVKAKMIVKVVKFFISLVLFAKEKGC